MASAGPASPRSFFLEAAEKTIPIGVPYTTSATGGTGTIKLTETLQGGTTTSSATLTVNVSGSSAGGIPFGLYGIRPDSNFTDPRWTGGYRTNTVMGEVMRQLRAANARSPKLGIWYNTLAGDEKVFRKSATDPSFDLVAWKDTLDSHLRATGFKSDGSSVYNDSIAPLVQSGALQGMVLIDDPLSFTPDPSYADIEAMATHMKLRLPSVLTAIRTPTDVLQPIAQAAGKTTYSKLDVAWAQYKDNKGPIAAWRNSEISRATTLTLGLVLGLNITAGQGPFPGTGHPISSDSLLSWGNSMLAPGASDYGCGFIMWDIHYPNLGDPNMATLANLAKNHVASPCKRH